MRSVRLRGRLALVFPPVLLAVAAIGALSPPTTAAATGGCRPWPETYAAPPEIRVLRVATGRVDVVPFRSYVENVMYWEWPSSYPTEALRAGAIAVKQYAWYYVHHPRASYVTPDGECYHVRDDTRDQKYDPSRTPLTAHRAAVEATWPLTLRKNGFFFLSGYGPGTSDVCGADLSSTRTRLAQRGVRACALEGRSMAEILRVYLDPGLTIANATRVFGPDRYATAAAVSASAFARGVPVVFIATALDFPDALAAGPAAARLGGPVLLVAPNSIPEVVAAELTRLAPAQIVVLGSAGVVSDEVLTALGAYAPSVIRVAGPDRYATAAETASFAFPEPGVPVVFVATGQNFPDALVGAAAGARLGGPVLLVPGDTIPERVTAELDRLRPATIRVLGSSAVVSDEVFAALGAYAPDVARLAGPDRFATAAAVSEATYPSGPETLYLATGMNFPDALAVGPLGGPVLLLPGWGAPQPVVAEAARLGPATLTPVGSAGALPDVAVSGIVAGLAAE